MRYSLVPHARASKAGVPPRSIRMSTSRAFSLVFSAQSGSSPFDKDALEQRGHAHPLLARSPLDFAFKLGTSRQLYTSLFMYDSVVHCRGIARQGPRSVCPLDVACERGRGERTGVG